MCRRDHPWTRQKCVPECGSSHFRFSRIFIPYRCEVLHTSAWLLPYYRALMQLVSVYLEWSRLQFFATFSIALVTQRCGIPTADLSINTPNLTNCLGDLSNLLRSFYQHSTSIILTSYQTIFIYKSSPWLHQLSMCTQSPTSTSGSSKLNESFNNMRLLSSPSELP